MCGSRPGGGGPVTAGSWKRGQVRTLQPAYSLQPGTHRHTVVPGAVACDLQKVAAGERCLTGAFADTSSKPGRTVDGHECSWNHHHGANHDRAVFLRCSV